MKFQPVVPISIGDDWNVISRTILPVIYTEPLRAAVRRPELRHRRHRAELLLLPTGAQLAGAEIIWGVGPAFQLPTATVGSLGAQEVGRRADGGHAEDGRPRHRRLSSQPGLGLRGNDNRKRFNQTFFQPFVTYTTHTATTFGANLEVQLRLRRQPLDRPR